MSLDDNISMNNYPNALSLCNKLTVNTIINCHHCHKMIVFVSCVGLQILTDLPESMIFFILSWYGCKWIIYYISWKDSPTLISKLSPFSLLGVFGCYSSFFLNFIEHFVSKHWRSRLDTASCGVWSGSALFAYSHEKDARLVLVKNILIWNRHTQLI